MSEHPITLSQESVNAILGGRKTQHRIIVTPQPIAFESFGAPCLRWRSDVSTIATSAQRIIAAHSRYGHPGAVLWVRELWAVRELQAGLWLEYPNGENFRVPADYAIRAARKVLYTDGWHSPVGMPRWASRLLLRVVSIRCERVQSISEDDARAEGVRKVDGGYTALPPGRSGDVWRTAHAAYAALWDTMNPKAPWVSNPWVWVIEFERIER